MKVSLAKRRFKDNNFSVSMLKISMLFTVVLQFFIGTSFYDYARTSLYALFVLTFIMIVMENPIVKTYKFLNIYLIFICMVMFFALIVIFLKGEWISAPFVEFILPFLILFMGYQSKVTKKQIRQIVLYYMLLVTVLGVYVVFYYGSGFTVTSQYFFSSKNQVGPFLSTVALISLMSILNNESGGPIAKNRMSYLIFSINIVSLLALRNRSGILALCFCLIVFFISKFSSDVKFKMSKMLTFFTIILITIMVQLTTNFFDSVFEMIYQSLFLNTDTSDINSLSSGRSLVYERVFAFMKESPFLGELSTISGITSTPHNYLLRLLLNYGFIGALPLILFYLFLWIFTIFNIVVKHRFDISLYLLLFMLVVSLFEYTFPYGPLTTVSLTWLLLGTYMRNNRITKQSNHKER